MKLLWVLCLIYLKNVKCETNQHIVEYYKNLINDGVLLSKSFKLPTNADMYKPQDFSVKDGGAFDYIIVGAGSSGSVIASRLTENKDLNVLLVEAGGYENNFTDIPAMFPYVLGQPFNWGFKSIPQTSFCLDAAGGKCSAARGKAVGGTSVCNANIYARGNRLDYDNWAAAGSPSWSYDKVLPYFKKSEHSSINGDEGFHGTEGYLHVEYVHPINEMLDAFIEANVELGRKYVDYNGEEQVGVSRVQYTHRNGRRDSAAKAFIGPASNRPNLKILTNSYVTKVLINNETKTAYGVLVSNTTGLYEIRAKKEVIISAGAISSPHLLMLSGIGPADHLKEKGIPLVSNLAVGENLQEHVQMLLSYLANASTAGNTLEHDVQEYLEGRGRLTHTVSIDGVAFLQTSYSNTSGYPDIELLFKVPKNIELTADKSTLESILQFRPSIMITKSRGSIKLNSRDPYAYPLIDYNQLSDAENQDIELLYAAIQMTQEITQTKPFEKHNVSLARPRTPMCDSLEYLSKEYWFCVIRQTTDTAKHPGGTCTMGPDPEKGAVVDNFLRVHGIKQLRVADASITPILPACHTNAVAIMIGEMASDFIINNE